MAPTDLEQSLFPQQVDMVLAFPAQATFRGGMGASTIDFCCLNDAVVRGYRGVHAVMTWHKKAHRPVQLQLIDNGVDVQHY
eukprot:3520623-Pyramimonas_sp.AAC.1